MKVEEGETVTADTASRLLTDFQFLEMVAAVDSLDYLRGVERQKENFKRLYAELDSVYRNLRARTRFEGTSVRDAGFWFIVGAGTATTLERILDDG